MLSSWESAHLFFLNHTSSKCFEEKGQNKVSSIQVFNKTFFKILFLFEIILSEPKKKKKRHQSWTENMCVKALNDKSVG